MTEELKEQIHERVYNIKVPTLGFSRRDLFNIAMEYAEPREKRIEELEKKAKNAWDENVRLVVNLRNEIESLKKENAELKATIRNTKAVDESFALQTIQLTKAKELLKEFVHHYKAKTIYIENMKDLLEQAKQFLSEVEK